MPDIRAIEGQALFDMPLNPGIPLHELWDKAESFENESPYRDMRYYRPMNLLVREYFERDLDEGPEDAEETISQSEKHLRLLNSMGLTVVSHCVEPAPATSEVAVPYLGRTLAYGASPFVPDTLRLDQKETYMSLTEAKIIKQLKEPALRYVDWCLKNHAAFVLDDIFDARQYSLHTTSGLIFLHDFDPIMSHKRPRAKFAELTRSLYMSRVGHI